MCEFADKQGLSFIHITTPVLILAGGKFENLPTNHEKSKEVNFLKLIFEISRYNYDGKGDDIGGFCSFEAAVFSIIFLHRKRTNQQQEVIIIFLQNYSHIFPQNVFFLVFLSS